MSLPELSKRMYDLDGHHGEVRTEDRPVRDSSLSCVLVLFLLFLFFPVSVLVSEAKFSRRLEHVENVNTLQGEVRSSVVLQLYKK